MTSRPDATISLRPRRYSVTTASRGLDGTVPELSTGTEADPGVQPPEVGAPAPVGSATDCSLAGRRPPGITDPPATRTRWPFTVHRGTTGAASRSVLWA